jgi:uncharacterized protein YjbI with pentapeptide repeats
LRSVSPGDCVYPDCAQIATLAKVKAKKADFTGAEMEGVDLTKANLERADFEAADLTGAFIVDAKLKEANFQEAVLIGATLIGSDVERADFTGAILLSADVSGLATIEAEDFRGAEWNDDTQLHPDMNTSIMVYVPEPGGTLSLVAGVIALAALGRSRSRS